MQEKEIKYAPLPEFDQLKQGVRQLPPVDKGDYIFIGAEVYDLPPQEESPEPPPAPAEEPIPPEPTLDERVTAVEEKTDEIVNIVEALI